MPEQKKYSGNNRSPKRPQNNNNANQSYECNSYSDNEGRS